MVKPNAEGSSVGLQMIATRAGLEIALGGLRRGDWIAEKRILGRELTVGILGDVALPTIRIVPAGEYYDYHAKYKAEDTQYLCPGLQGAAEEEIRALALEAFRTYDRVLASMLGVKAFEMALEKQFGRMVSFQNNAVTSVTLEEATKEHRLVDKNSYRVQAARGLGISFGD